MHGRIASGRRLSFRVVPAPTVQSDRCEGRQGRIPKRSVIGDAWAVSRWDVANEA